ncbi:cadherin-like domain-containing protein, partial [Sulfuricurvum sp. RIFCSPLOWO2_12_FULL_43_24]
MARTVGTVKSISGKAAVKTLNDQLHVLNVGEALHENEMVYALGTDSKVTLTLEGGRELTLNGNDEILLDKSVFSVLDEGEALDVKALQQALAETLNPENLEETAAGQEVVGDANAGAEFADRNDARGDPSSYLTGTESSPLAVTLEPDNPQTQNTAPDATDDSYDPEAENDALSTPEDSSLTILPATLLSNDSDIDGNTLSIIGVQDATNGTVALVDGNIVFTPNTNYNGPASFTYTISDGQGGSDTATVNINVTPVNDTPTIEVTANDFTEDSGVLAGATAGTYVTS